jgi:hypothetical protein
MEGPVQVHSHESPVARPVGLLDRRRHDQPRRVHDRLHRPHGLGEASCLVHGQAVGDVQNARGRLMRDPVMTAATASARMSAARTRKPSCEKARQQAAPMPPAAPRITATPDVD